MSTALCTVTLCSGNESLRNVHVYKNVFFAFLFMACLLRFNFLEIFTPFLFFKMSEKWHIRIIKQQIKMAFFFCFLQ